MRDASDLGCWKDVSVATEPQPCDLTIDDLYALPDGGYRYDVIDGQLLRMSRAGRRHARIEMHIGLPLGGFVTSNSLGEAYGADAGYILSRDPLVFLSPDVSFVRQDRLPTPANVDDEGFLEIAPDLAVEVISPSNSAREMPDKVMVSLEHGMQQVWLVEPRRQIVTVYGPERTARIHRSGEVISGGELLPGFELVVDEIFV
jgi:Uma2 family endonuclease